MLIADPAAVLESPVLCGWDDVWDHTSVPPCLLRSRAWRSVVAMKGVSVRNFHVKVDFFLVYRLLIRSPNSLAHVHVCG